MSYVTIRNGILVLSLAGLTACPSGPDRMTITETTTRSETRPPIQVGASSRDRFAFALPEQTPGAQVQSGDQLSWHWDTPEGWTKNPPTQFRTANLTFGPNGEGECILTVMPNGGGGVMANVNRWYGQMELPPLTPSEFDALERKDVAGIEAVLLDIEGGYKGMGMNEAKSDYRMLGALFEVQGLGVFAKMVGPSDVVAAEEENFHAWLDSIHSAGPGEHHDHDHDHPEQGADLPMEEPMETTAGPVDPNTPLPADHPPIGDVSVGPVDSNAPLPEGHPPVAASQSFDVAQATPEADEEGRASADGFSWLAPEDWEAESRPMRLISYTLGESGKTECYITILPGDAGGAVANINRWRGQMGAAPDSEDAIDAYPKIDVLGEPTPLLEVTGDYTSMRGDTMTDQTMLAVAAIRSGQSVFIRMTGAKEEVAKHKDAFVAFCNSVRKD